MTKKQQTEVLCEKPGKIPTFIHFPWNLNQRRSNVLPCALCSGCWRRNFHIEFISGRPMGGVLERLPSAAQPGRFTARHITNSDGIKAFNQIPQSNNSFQWWDPGARGQGNPHTHPVLGLAMEEELPCRLRAGDGTCSASLLSALQ